MDNLDTTVHTYYIHLLLFPAEHNKQHVSTHYQVIVIRNIHAVRTELVMLSTGINNSYKSLSGQIRKNMIFSSRSVLMVLIE